MAKGSSNGKICLGKRVKANSPAFISDIPSAKGLPFATKSPSAAPVQVKTPKIREPRSAVSPARTRFRPSATQLPGAGIGKPIRG